MLLFYYESMQSVNGFFENFKMFSQNFFPCQKFGKIAIVCYNEKNDR